VHYDALVDLIVGAIVREFDADAERAATAAAAQDSMTTFKQQISSTPTAIASGRGERHARTKRLEPPNRPNT
jgi:hypothetical protein